MDNHANVLTDYICVRMDRIVPQEMSEEYKKTLNKIIALETIIEKHITDKAMKGAFMALCDANVDLAGEANRTFYKAGLSDGFSLLFELADKLALNPISLKEIKNLLQGTKGECPDERR